MGVPILSVYDENGNMIEIPAIVGRSAYKDAVSQGFKGSLTEWLESLKGRGVVSILCTSGNGSAGTFDTYTIAYTDGTSSTFTVYNGADGDDYVLTPADKAEIARQAADLVDVSDVVKSTAQTLTEPEKTQARSNIDAASMADIAAISSEVEKAIADLQKGGMLTVETITVDDSGETETIPVTGITLDYTSISLNTGESMQLAASITPSNATNTAVTWESSADSIATVVNGYVTAVSEGSAVITAKSAENPSIMETCAVVVAEETGGGGDTPTGGKVQLSTHNIVDGSCVNKNGEVKTINDSAHYVEIPYTENMQISTTMSTSWVNTYPPFIVKSGDTYSVPGYTLGDENLDTKPGTGTTYATQYLTALTGYAAESTVIVNMTYADITANDVYYYVVGGGE